MRVQIQPRIVTDDDTVLSDEVIASFDKGDDQLEEIGLSLEQAKTMLAGAQTSLVAAQAASFLARHRPLTALFTGHTAPELLYLETRWASLVSYDLTAGLLKDVLPVDTRTNAATIRNHLHK